MLHGFLYVENLTAQGEDSLVCAVATGLGGAACRVSLDEEEFTFGRVFGGAVCEFAGESAAGERRLAEYRLTGIARGYTRLGSEDDFLHNAFGIIGVLFEVISQCLAYSRGHHTCHFGVAQFGLGLSFELRFSHFDGDDGCESLTEVIRVDGGVTFLVAQFGFLEEFALLGVFLHHAGESRAEALYVRSAFYGVDIIDIRMDVLVEIAVVDHSHFNGCAVLACIEMNNIGDEGCAGLVDITDELAQAFFGIERLRFARAVLIDHAFVFERDTYTGVEESEFAHTIGEDVPLIDGFRKDAVIGEEMYESTGFALFPVADRFGFADGMDRG